MSDDRWTVDSLRDHLKELASMGKGQMEIFVYVPEYGHARMTGLKVQSYQYSDGPLVLVLQHTMSPRET